MLKLLFTLPLLFLTDFPAAAQGTPPLPADKIARIEEAVRAEMGRSKIPGASVAVAVGDQVRYAKGFGAADLEDAAPATAQTVYRLGSLTKTITAVAVMQLAERGKLDLDAPVQKYCPAYPAKAWPLSARQLLAHLGGVRDYDNQKFLEEYFSTRHYGGVVEGLDIFKNDPLLHEPGTKYAYSTYGYNLLGCAVEGASGAAYEDYVRENLLRPALMERTAVDDVLRIIAGRARGYARTREGATRNTQLADTSNKIPGGGLASTAEDMCRFAVALLGGKFVSRATLDQMWTVQKTRDGQATQYGLGWRVGERNGAREVYHGGAAAGFSTFLHVVPEKKTAVALMANLELLGQKQRDDLARLISDIVTQ